MRRPAKSDGDYCRLLSPRRAHRVTFRARRRKSNGHTTTRVNQSPSKDDASTVLYVAALRDIMYRASITNSPPLVAQGDSDSRPLHVAVFLAVQPIPGDIFESAWMRQLIRGAMACFLEVKKLSSATLSRCSTPLMPHFFLAVFIRLIFAPGTSISYRILPSPPDTLAERRRPISAWMSSGQSGVPIAPLPWPTWRCYQPESGLWTICAPRKVGLRSAEWSGAEKEWKEWRGHSNAAMRTWGERIESGKRTARKLFKNITLLLTERHLCIDYF